MACELRMKLRSTQFHKKYSKDGFSHIRKSYAGKLAKNKSIKNGIHVLKRFLILKQKILSQ